MYRLTIPKEKFGDLIILLLFDKVFDEEFMVDNERFNAVFEKLKDKGIKSILFSEYFNLDSKIKNRYKKFRSHLQEEGEDVSLFLFHTDTIEESEDFYKELIRESVKKLTKKEHRH